MSEEGKTTFERYRETLEKRTITEKLDYKTLLLQALQMVEQSILSGDQKIIESAIWTFHNLFPTSLHDEQFTEDSKKWKITEQRDIRPVVAGNLRGSEEMCKKLGIPAFENFERTDHYVMLNSCINLMQRLDMLMRNTPKAWIPGKSGVIPPPPKES